MQKVERFVIGLCAVILLILFVQTVRPKKYVPELPPAPLVEENCIGTPITVAYPYLGGVNDPWDCKVQCDDDEPRYILYSNGKATQCETSPGCNDYGEDRGITCKLPAAK